MDNSLEFNIYSTYSGHARITSVETHLEMFKNQVLDLNGKMEDCFTALNNALESRSAQIKCLEETNTNLRNELNAVKESFLYFDVSKEMDNDERIKYQQQFIQQEIEVMNLRTSNQDLQAIIDKYRQQNTEEFVARGKKNYEDMMEALGFTTDKEEISPEEDPLQ